MDKLKTALSALREKLMYAFCFGLFLLIGRSRVTYYDLIATESVAAVHLASYSAAVTNSVRGRLFSVG